MDASRTQPEAPLIEAHREYHGIAVKRWFIVHGLLLLGALGATFLLLGESELSFAGWDAFTTSVRQASPAVKLLIFAMYMSVCTTFLPMNTGWLVSAVAMQSVAVADDMLTTVLLVASVGAAASTVANLTDYHIFTLLMRSRRIAKVRHTRTYEVAAKWFDHNPFLLQFIFNLLPIPVDVVRILAALRRYPRLAFAAANFLGRLCRYGIIAAITYHLAEKGYWATIVLFAFAVAVGLSRLIRSRLGRSNNNDTPEAKEAS